MMRTLVASALLLAAVEVHAGLLCYSYRYAPNLVQAVQTVLKDQGFYSGTIDGMWGPKTKDAVRKFQVTKHIPVHESRITVDTDEGELSPATLAALFPGAELPQGVTRVPNPNGFPTEQWQQYCK